MSSAQLQTHHYKAEYQFYILKLRALQVKSVSKKEGHNTYQGLTTGKYNCNY